MFEEYVENQSSKRVLVSGAQTTIQHLSRTRVVSESRSSTWKIAGQRSSGFGIFSIVLVVMVADDVVLIEKDNWDVSNGHGGARKSERRMTRFVVHRSPRQWSVSSSWTFPVTILARFLTSGGDTCKKPRRTSVFVYAGHIGPYCSTNSSTPGR